MAAKPEAHGPEIAFTSGCRCPTDGRTCGLSRLGSGGTDFRFLTKPVSKSRSASVLMALLGSPCFMSLLFLFQIHVSRGASSFVESDSDNDWHSISEPTGKLESSPSRIELDYLTMELHAQGSMPLGLGFNFPRPSFRLCSRSPAVAVLSM